MLRLPDSWVWDAWYVRDGDTYHVFFLYASRALHDPALRHRRASIGHAISTDLVSWERVEDALVRGVPPSFDQTAVWTGSVVRGDDGRWLMFYTGAAATDEGSLVQQIGLAVSEDLMTWHRYRRNPVLSVDDRWYETLGGTPAWEDEHWRDPLVVRDPHGDGWHMLLTARAATGPEDQRGVLGHATSHDLVHWEARPPLTRPGAGFGLLEVPAVERVDERYVLVFSCPAHQLGADRAALGPGGIWYATGPSALGPFDIAGARLLADERWYVGKLLRDPEDGWVLIAFANTGEDGGFVGELTDPRPVRWVEDELVLDPPPVPDHQPEVLVRTSRG